MRISARQLALLPILLLQGLMGMPASAEDKPAFPVDITHAFGTTVISEKPVRVATVAWANHEVPLALGIVPVGFARANFGDDDGDGLLPWASWLSPLLGFALWPWLFLLLDGLRLRTRDRAS